jgi:putative transcriptional regulator
MFSLNHHFLLATPSMVDPIFKRSLVYLCGHKKQGAMGVIVNKPADLGLVQLFEQIGLPIQNTQFTAGSVLFGGPIQFDRGFVLHTSSDQWQSSLAVNDELMLTTSKDVLVATAKGKGPEQLLVTLGYASWSEGQLEKELKENTWLTMPASLDILFNVPASERYDAAMSLLGLNVAHLSGEVGYA